MTEEVSARRKLRDVNSPSFAGDPIVTEMLSRLDQLERQTDPRRADSENEKDAAAGQALKIASELAAYVAGWAVDHKVGLAIDGYGNIPDLMLTARTPAYNELRETVNSHQHEASGLQPAKLPSSTKRKALANLFRFNIGGLDEPLRDSLAEALEALEYGETLELLEPEKDGLKRQLRELKLQLWALCYVEYKHEIGGKKYELREDAGEAFGVGENTVRNWEYRLREWDAHTVANALSRAGHCGKIDRANGALRFDEIWGLSALKRYGTEYKAILRSKKSA